MPISLTPFTSGTLCFGNKWEITNQSVLEEIVAMVLLGRVDHAQKILDGLNIPTSQRNINNAIDDAIAKLTAVNLVEHYHRDGLVFQIFSWIAAHKHTAANTVIADPHLIPAQKGFDGLQIDISPDNNSIETVRVYEDKATENPRNTITGKVWPEFKTFYDGERESELDYCLTTLLKYRTDLINDVDNALESLIWSDTRKFRVAITVDHSHDNEDGIKSMFKGYDVTVPGDRTLRQSEYICFDDLRNWMDNFSTNVIVILESRKTDV